MRPPVVLAAAALALSGMVPAAAGPGVPVPGPSTSPLPRAAAPCTIEGGPGPNVLVGTPGPDVICGYGGNDVLEGLEAEDVLNGGSGNDTATWASTPCCVRADLAAGTATGTMGADRLMAVEHLEGSRGADVLRGTAAANTLSGLDATDLLYGGDGDDTLLGGAGDDWLAGEGGANTLDGEDGADVCADGPGTSCDPTSPVDGDDTRGPVDVALVATDLAADPATWWVRMRGRSSASRLWDQGYAVISFDTTGGDEFDVHAVARWTRRGVRGVMVRDGARGSSGRVEARRTGGRGVRIRIPPARLEVHPERPYYRWAVQTIYTGPGCRPCFDPAPQVGAYPQPV